MRKTGTVTLEREAHMPKSVDLRIPTTTKDLIQSVLKGGGVKKGDKSAKGS